MAEKGSKKGLGLLIAALASIAGIALLARKAGAKVGLKIDAPSRATAGSQVPVKVTVANLGTSTQYLAITGVYDSIGLTWVSTGNETVGPGQTVSFTSSFTMPSADAKVTVFKYHRDPTAWETGWVFDETGSVIVALA